MADITSHSLVPIHSLLKLARSTPLLRSLAMSTPLLQRLDATIALLESCRGAPNYAEVSAGQAAAVIARLGSCTLQESEKLELAERIGRCLWASPDEKTSILDALLKTSSASARKGTKYQDFTSLEHNLTQRLWARLLSPDVPPNLKLIELIDHAIALGMRICSEPSYAKLTALYALCSEGSDRAKVMTKEHIGILYSHVKKTVRERSKKAPLEKVDVLPMDAAQFRTTHPATFSAVFGDAGPIACQVPALDLISICDGIDMRDRKGGKENKLMIGNVPANGQMQMMQQFGQMMMQCMAAMMQNGTQAPNGDGKPIPIQIYGQPHNSLQGPVGSASAVAGSGLPFWTPPKPAAPADLFGAGGQAPPPAPADSPAPCGPVEEASAATNVPDITVKKGAKQPKRSVDEAAQIMFDAMQGKKATKEGGSKKGKSDSKKGKSDTKMGKGDNKKGKGGHKKEKLGDGKEQKMSKKPSFSNEASRSQILYRTGLAGPGQSVRIPYGGRAEEQRAIEKAKRMVVAECKKRGLS